MISKSCITNDNTNINMKIRLEGFRTYYSETEVSFPDTGTFLISAFSGYGKTTIFRAIAWCLYGKERNVYSWVSSKKCWVEWQYKNWTILRRKNPERLNVKHIQPDGTIVNLESAEAQNYIIHHFGSREKWNSSSYLCQGARSLLTEMTSAERMTLLEEVVFTGEEHPQKIVDKLNNLKKQYQKEEDKITNCINSLPKKYTDEELMKLLQFPIEFYTPEKIVELREQINVLENQLYLIEVVEKQEKELTALKQQSVEVKTQIDELPEQEFDFNQLQEFDVFFVMKDLYDKQNSKLNNVKKPLFSEEDVEIETNKNKKYNDYLNICRKYNIPNPETDWEEKITAINTLLDNWDILNEYHRLNYLQEDELVCFDRLDEYLTTHTLQDIEVETRKFNDFMKWCSKTFGSLLAKTSDVEKVYKKFKSDAEKWGRCREYIQSYRQYKDWLSEYNNFIRENLNYANLDLVQVEELLVKARDEYQRLMQSTENLSCPCCNKWLRIKNNKLFPASEKPATQDDINLSCEKVKQLSYLLRLLQQNEDNECEWGEEDEDLLEWGLYVEQSHQKIYTEIIKYVECGFDIVEKPRWNIEQVAKFINHKRKVFLEKEIGQDLIKQNNLPSRSVLLADRQKYNILLSHQCYKSSYDNSVITDAINYYKQQNEIYKLNSQLSEYTKDKPFIVEYMTNYEYDELKELYSSSKQIFNRKRELNNILVNIQTKIYRLEKDNKTKSISGNKENIREEINSLRRKENHISDYIHCIEEKKRCDMWLKELGVIQKKNQAVTFVYEKSKHLQHLMLEDFINTLNTIIDEILCELFDEVIHVNFQLFKANEKPGLNMDITYKGVSSLSLNDLSGGEQHRVNIALVLALNIMCDCDYLILDEPFGSLDEDLVETCMESINNLFSKYNKEKCIYIVSHQRNSGLYDSTFTPS